MKDIFLGLGNSSCSCCPSCAALCSAIFQKPLSFSSSSLNRTFWALSFHRESLGSGTGIETVTETSLRQTDEGCIKGASAARYIASSSVIREGGSGGHSTKSSIFGGRVLGIDDGDARDDSNDIKDSDDEERDKVTEQADIGDGASASYEVL